MVLHAAKLVRIMIMVIILISCEGLFSLIIWVFVFLITVFVSLYGMLCSNSSSRSILSSTFWLLLQHLHNFRIRPGKVHLRYRVCGCSCRCEPHGHHWPEQFCLHNSVPFYLILRVLRYPESMSVTEHNFVCQNYGFI